MRHEKLQNHPRKPCEKSPDYSFAKCVEKYIMNSAGCQPPWRRFTIEQLPLCDNGTMLNRFREAYEKIAGPLVKEEIIDVTKCLMPCTYMEYKVRNFYENYTLLNSIFRPQ